MTPYELGLAAIAVVAAFIAVAFTFAPGEPPTSGAVLGTTQSGPTASPPASPRIVTPPSTRPSDSGSEPGAGAPSAGSPPTGVVRPSRTPEDLTLTVGRAVVRTWNDSFERSRLQIIVPVRNDGDRWVGLPDASSTYQIVTSGSEMVRGRLVALPALIGPGETAYLVDTVSIEGNGPIGDLVATSDVVALPTDPPELTLTVTDVRLTTGVGGGLLASGTVHNDSEATTRRVIAGAVALDADGTPVAAVFDPFDIGRLDPDEARSFVTDSQPGGPPIDDAVVSELVGVAFEVGP